MSSFPALLVAVLFFGAQAAVTVNANADADEGANPIRKIVTLLQDMQKEIEAEGAKEKELFDKFMCFCSGGAEELQKTIADAASDVETLTGKLEEEKAEKSGLEGDLVKHKADLAAATADLEKAQALRSKEQAENEADLADQETNYGAVSSSIPALEKGMGASSLLQTSPTMKSGLTKAIAASQTISAEEKHDLTAFLEQKEEYSPVSGQIVGILKSMSDEMEKTIADLKTQEAEAAKGFSELKVAKETEAEAAKEAIETKTKRVGELAVSVVESADGIDDATKEGADAKKFLATLDEQCKTKQAEYATVTKTRAEEISAISETISILNDDDALDVFKKAVPSALLQRSSSRKFGFLQGKDMVPTDRLRKAVGIITSAAQFHRSPKLDFLSLSLKSKLKHASQGAVDFGAILKMIDEMVTVLTAEEADDTKHKEWCTSELASSEDEMKATEGKLAALASSIAEATDEAAGLGEDVTALTAKIAGLDKDVAVATEMRKADHAEYLETIALTEAAISLIGKAKNRMQKFYNPALYKPEPKVELSAEDKIISNLGGASFVQVHHHSHRSKITAPKFEGSFLQQPYEKKTEKSGGALALMDSIVADLKLSLGEAEHDEKTSTTDYTELMADSQASRASDSKAITDKSAAKADLEAKIVKMKENQALTNDALVNVHAYISELHGSCDFILDNFQLRSDARKNEIESLKNAKAVLSGASYS